MSVTERHFEQLRHQGFTIIENVVSEEQCDIWLREYNAWLDQFKGNKWPFTVHSPINTYNNGYLETTWKARLATKAVFSKLWSTDKLVSTIDGIVIRHHKSTVIVLIHQEITCYIVTKNTERKVYMHIMGIFLWSKLTMRTGRYL
jgi:hypothetical protein